MVKRRQLNVFTLSFLDVMAGGFGAVVIIFLIINHATEDEAEATNRELLSESRLLDYKQRTGEENLASIRELVGSLRIRVADARERVVKVVEDIDDRKTDLDELEKLALAQKNSLEELRSDVETREDELQKLSRAEDTRGTATIEIVGEGDRQYLTGLFMGGNHILIALDMSASMLDETIVNILRRRNMSLERQLAAPKWQRAVKTVTWLTANIPLDSSFQIVLFSEQAEFLIDDGSWQLASNADAIADALVDLGGRVPKGGTNLQLLFKTIAQMRPIPDNLFLIVDGLPTLEERESRRTRVTGRQRIGIFRRSVAHLPAGIPVNVIMFPLEGDPYAAASYWNLSHITAGTFMAPSADWP